MNKLLILVVCVFFTHTTLAQTWYNKQSDPTRGSDIRIMAEGSYELAFEEDGMSRYGVDAIIGHQPNSDFFIGGGIGFRMYEDLDDMIIPIFVDVRRYFLDNYNIQPYIGIKGGYSVTAEGLFFSPSGGMNFQMKGNTAFHIGIGVTVQKFKELETNSSAGLITIGLKL